MDNKFDITIIGAGIVGLAIAEELSRFHKNILVIDKEKTFGQHISSRNSEVIHSGFYYPFDSLKSKLCIKGNELLYAFAQSYHINYKKCGKLIIANSSSDSQKLKKIMDNAQKCGLKNLSILNREESKKIEPLVNCVESLWVPSTGIIDSHGVMSKLEFLSRQRDVSFAYKTKINSISKINDYYELTFDDVDTLIKSNTVINSAGLWSDKVSSMLGIDDYKIEYYKGDYYKSRNIKNLNCLIYPIPKISSLGIHSVLSLNGDVSFGPNIYKVDKIKYSIDDTFKDQYLLEIKQLLDVKNIEIDEDFSGIRPKIKFDGNFNDFIIKNEVKKGYKNFINLIGIDSPGLTSSLAIAKYVNNLIL
tara:strand:- start:166 stop:1248 length:1083 start_codon:yes stop_codon:yes gene_type:complete